MGGISTNLYSGEPAFSQSARENILELISTKTGNPIQELV
ncbi:hypothetical protein BN903_85 [Halorubrum sp. AJ67]|nr:hypothetical protein BN903_85 [Halorubrum sp. AJ67]